MDEMVMRVTEACAAVHEVGMGPDVGFVYLNIVVVYMM
jgi:hypothetical protein